MAGTTNKVIGTRHGALVTGTGAPFRPRRAVLRLGLLGGLAALTAVLAFGGYAAYRHKHQAMTGPQGSHRLDTLQQTRQLVTDKYQAARNELPAKLAAARTPADKSKVYTGMANLADQAGDSRQALVYAQQAADANPSANGYIAVGYRAESIKSYAAAADAYGKAVALLKSSGMREDNRDYQAVLSLQQQAEAKR